MFNSVVPKAEQAKLTKTYRYGKVDYDSESYQERKKLTEDVDIQPNSKLSKFSQNRILGQEGYVV